MQAAGRGAALAALLQASLTVTLLVLIGARWWPLLLVGGAAALLQLMLSLRLFRNLHEPKHWARAAGLSLGFAALVIGAYLQALLHIHATFTEVGAARANQFIGAIAVGLPYLLALPIWQAYTSRALGKKTALLALFCALLPFSEGPDGVEQMDSADHASWAGYAWSTWNGSPSAAPSALEGSLLITPVEAGDLGTTRWSEPQSLTDAIRDALPATKPGEKSALLVEFSTSRSNTRGPVLANSATPVHAGLTALISENTTRSALQLLRSDGWIRGEAAPGIYVPAIRTDDADPPTTRVGVEAWIVNSGGATRLTEGWQAGPALTAETALNSAIAGGDYLLRNQADTGRFHYVVRGPSGKASTGYNYPRHAGTTWYLARLAARTGEQRFRVGAERGVQFLATHSQRTDGGRAYILDPARKDGKAWVGTTALAALAANRLGDTEWAGLWGRHVAASVDEDGQIRGNYQIEADTYPPQATITYGQGQGLLALATLHADGMESLGEALDRASAYVNGGYFSQPGSFLLTLDEHWTCIAGLATYTAGRGTAGTDACHAYLANQRFDTPGATAALSPGTAAAGGLVEAFAAAARLDRQQGGEGGWWLDLALTYGHHFLRSQYQGADALLLPRPERLMGGYRNRPWDLDVQIDTVQHIGSALLGIEALLSERDEPGSWS